MRVALVALATIFLLGAADARAARIDLKLWPDEMCDTPRIVKAVSKRFNWAQRTTFENDTRIVEMREPHEYHYHQKDPLFHDRRFCRATAVMQDGGHRTVYYLLSYDRYPPLHGGLEFCVLGHDYFRAYAPGCSQLRPR